MNRLLPRPSLMTRIIVGKLTGFAIGLLGLVLLPAFLPNADWWLRIGAVLWYTTLGAIIGVFGVVDWHPVLRVRMPWWLVMPAVGAWMNAVVVMLAHASFVQMMASMLDGGSVLRSPFWFAAEGAVVGFVIGYLATRFGGEGPATAGR